MEKQQPKRRRYILIFWILYAVPFLTISTIFYLIATDHMGFMPTFEELENPKSNLASEIFSSDQELLGKYYIENRTFVSFDDLSPHLINALIATEDSRFHEHSGIDGRALSRVVYGVLTGNSQGGGSTVTQQLAKNLFPRDTTRYKSSISRAVNMMIVKFKEWVTAVKLEKNYTKEEIMVMYLNTVTFGHQTFGIKSAARTFFNVSPDSLRIEQAAMLIGVLKAPTAYSPILNPENALHRREVVLSQMEKYGFITETEYDSIRQLPFGLEYKVQDHKQGLATYFREYLRMVLTAKKPDKKNYWSVEEFYSDSAKWETDPLYGWCNKNFKSYDKDGVGIPYNIYKDGLKIYTTINSKMQQYAEDAVYDHLSNDLQIAFFNEQKGRSKAPYGWNMTEKQIKTLLTSAMKRTERYHLLKLANVNPDSIEAIFNKPVPMTVFSWRGEIDTTMSPMDSIKYYKHFLRASFMSMEPSTGYVKAYVGGINYKYFQFDQVCVGRRQVGSTFKPFLYTLAMEEGYSPCYMVPNIPTTFEMPDGQPDWTPKNSGKTDYDGKMVTLEWGLANSVNYISAWLMKQFKPKAVVKIAKKMGIKSHLDEVPSICLGSSDVKLSEMVGAYCTFANKGVYTEPIFVTRITDKNGNILMSFTPEKKEAMNERTAYLMIHLLKNVVLKGTSMRLRFKYGLINEIAAKTGTTDNHSDGWFMGITPNLVSGAWVGGEERGIHFRSIAYGQGANMALPIWAKYMNKVYNNKNLNYSREDVFEKPPHFNVKLDCGKMSKEDVNQTIDIFDDGDIL